MSFKRLGRTLIEKSMSKIIHHQDMRLCTIKISFTTFGISRGKKTTNTHAFCYQRGTIRTSF